MNPELRSWVEVSRGRIAENYRGVKKLVGPDVEIAAVVKADAYGHGMIEVSRVLVTEGAKWLAVSSLDEGVALRQAGIEARVLVMADYYRSNRASLVEYRLTPALHSLEQLADLEAFTSGRGVQLDYHLKVDTGMGRLGTRAAAVELAEAIRRAPHLRLEGLMSHFASAADYSSPQSEEQDREFEQLATELGAMGIVPPLRHLASTNAITYGRKQSWYNMVRPGHALYGYVSSARGNAPPKVLRVKPALGWKATILEVKEVPEGARIGYGAMYRAPKPMRIAVLGVGYADGLSHRLSNRGHVLAGGRMAPILGAVSMDLTTIDVSAAPALRAGDAVTLLGREADCEINAQQMARVAGTISYDILCGIRARVKRVYTP